MFGWIFLSLTVQKQICEGKKRNHWPMLTCLHIIYIRIYAVNSLWDIEYNCNVNIQPNVTYIFNFFIKIYMTKGNQIILFFCSNNYYSKTWPAECGSIKTILDKIKSILLMVAHHRRNHIYCNIIINQQFIWN